jgi:hypothetical protein
MLDGIERRPLGGEQRARLAAQAEQIGARRHLRAVLRQPLDRDIGIERAEERLGDRQPRHHDRIAAVHHPREHRIGGDHRVGSDIPRPAQILGERGGDESVQIEAVEGKTHAAH